MTEPSTTPTDECRLKFQREVIDLLKKICDYQHGEAQEYFVWFMRLLDAMGRVRVKLGVPFRDMRKDEYVDHQDVFDAIERAIGKEQVAKNEEAASQDSLNSFRHQFGQEMP